jgi:hypothetical protein
MRIPAPVFRLAEARARLLLASADSGGIPHLAAAGALKRISPERLEVRAWFCPQTLANLHENSRCSLVIWDSAADEGYQLVGKADAVQQGAMLNGYTPGEAPLPQVEYSVTIQVDRVLEFRHAPHTDAEIAIARPAQS